MTEFPYAGQAMRSALGPIVDAAILARDSAVVTGHAIDGQGLMEIITRVYPDPPAVSSIAEALDYALNALGLFHCVSVVLVVSLLDRFCGVTGEDGADVLRQIIESFPEQPSTGRPV